MLAEQNQIPSMGFICFPLILHSFDLLVSSFGVWVVTLIIFG